MKTKKRYLVIGGKLAGKVFKFYGKEPGEEFVIKGEGYFIGQMLFSRAGTKHLVDVLFHEVFKDEEVRTAIDLYFSLRPDVLQKLREIV